MSIFKKKQEELILPSGAKALRDSVNEAKAPKRRRASKSEAKRYTRSKVGNFFYCQQFILHRRYLLLLLGIV